uniref:CCR4-NOT transcription complex subunit 11 n=1 Tax=Trichuris muris TaxID=70415 RepID=A0A5S6Q7G7_TRIMR
MVDVNNDSESVDSHGQPKSMLEPSRTSLKQASTLGKTFRIDDWIESLTTGDPSGIPPATVSSLPYNTLQQIGPWLKIEPFDSDPRRWETFMGSFRALVHDVVQSDVQRIAILSQLLSPRSRAALGSCLYSPETYSAALANLRRLFVDPSRALNMHIHDLMNISPMKNNSEGRDNELRSKSILHFVLMMLSYRLKAACAKKVFQLLPREASLVDLNQWLEEMVIV